MAIDGDTEHQFEDCTIEIGKKNKTHVMCEFLCQWSIYKPNGLITNNLTVLQPYNKECPLWQNACTTNVENYANKVQTVKNKFM